MPRLAIPMLRRASSARLCTAALLSVQVALAPLAARAQQTPPIPLHVVEPGDTLWQIANRNGLDTATLMQLNGMEDGDFLLAGATLKLGAVAVPGQRSPQPIRMHTVAEGDTLAGIAALYGVLVDSLVEANGIEDPNLVVLGAQLKVPGAVPAASEPAPAVAAIAPAPAPQPAAVTPSPSSPSRRSLMSTYIVQPGETLNGVARQYGVDPQVIAQATGLENPNVIPVGAILKIPVPAREHTIVAGETLYRIAALERVDLGALIDFNEIADPGMIRVGDVLVIPASPQTAATLPAPAPSAAPAPIPAATPPAAPAPGSAVTPTATPPTPKPVPVPPGTPTDGAVGQAIKLRGMPYVFGGSGPSSFDCSGFVWYVFKQVGKPVSRGLFSQYNSGSHPAKDQLKPGDIVFFQNTYMPGLSHNGIYIGDGSFIHAADERSGVTISSLAAPYWASRWFGATRIP